MFGYLLTYSNVCLLLGGWQANENSHRNGRLASEPQEKGSSPSQKSIILHHKSQVLKHFGD
jgi:hypothetical protein